MRRTGHGLSPPRRGRTRPVTPLRSCRRSLSNPWGGHRRGTDGATLSRKLGSLQFRPWIVEYGMNQTGLNLLNLGVCVETPKFDKVRRDGAN